MAFINQFNAQPGMMMQQSNQHVLRAARRGFSNTLGWVASFPPFLEGRYSREEFKTDIDSINDIISLATSVSLPSGGRVSIDKVQKVLLLLFPLGMVFTMLGAALLSQDDDIGGGPHPLVFVGMATCVCSMFLQVGLAGYLLNQVEKVTSATTRGDEIATVPDYVEKQLAPKYARFGAHIEFQVADGIMLSGNNARMRLPPLIIVTDTAAAPPPAVASVLGVQPMGIVQPPVVPLAQPLPTPPRRSFLSKLSPFAASPFSPTAPPATPDVEAPPNPLASDAAKTPMDRLLELKQIHAAGLISDAEMQAKREAILGDM